jgi:hypothetical protein
VGRNAQVRRFRRDLDKKLHHTGPAGESNPFGNREQRRSKDGKAQMVKMLQQLRQMPEKLNMEQVNDN